KFKYKPTPKYADGSKTDCKNWSADIDNPNSGQVVASVTCKGKKCTVNMGSARGPAKIKFICKGNSQIKDKILVTGNGGKGTFRTSEIRSWTNPAYPTLVLTDAETAELNNLVDNDSLLGTVVTGGSSRSNRVLLVGGAVVVGVAVIAGAMAAADSGSGDSFDTSACKSGSICGTIVEGVPVVGFFIPSYCGPCPDGTFQAGGEPACLAEFGIDCKQCLCF
ncbi:MAG: hypothetical protein V3T30_08050, partial [Thermodesulfobacteriota bacterium]